MTSATQRARYEPSGNVDWERFGPMALLVLIGAAALAEGMNLLTAAGWYLLFLVPLFAAVLVCGLMWKAIRIGRCRWPAMAAWLGILAALVLYLGQFYFGMISEAGIEAAPRLDLLPRYIDYRMKTEVTHDAAKPDYPGRGDKEPIPVMNWFQFIFEFGLILFLIPFLSYRMCARPYCEECRRWKEQSVILFPPGSAGQIAGMFESGRLGELPALAPPVAQSGKKFTSVVVETCQEPAFGRSCPVYFSVKEVSSGNTIGTYQQTDGAVGRWWVRRAELTPGEIDSLRPIFPSLAATAPWR